MVLCDWVEFEAAAGASRTAAGRESADGTSRRGRLRRATVDHDVSILIKLDGAGR